MHTNIRPGCHWLTVTNALAYYSTLSINAAKTFYILGLHFLSSEKKFFFMKKVKTEGEEIGSASLGRKTIFRQTFIQQNILSTHPWPFHSAYKRHFKRRSSSKCLSGKWYQTKWRCAKELEVDFIERKSFEIFWVKRPKSEAINRFLPSLVLG